jgi:A/G-specific adenine glycosylase
LAKHKPLKDKDKDEVERPSAAFLSTGTGIMSDRPMRLLAWYMASARKLPWRESHDTYRIWLSEVMLQQTQVVTVIDYYKRFLERYPDVRALAAAEEEDVLKLWEGLGYYSRARRLIPCARRVVEHHGGKFPASKAALLALPGIGAYTAGAILSIAFDQRVAAIDGNVLRVASRWYALETDIRLPAAHAVIEARLMAEMPQDARHFNQALMELGARVCTPRQPLCKDCPVSDGCAALASGRVDRLPNKSKAKAKVASEKLVAYVTCQGKVLLEKRGPDELLGSLWGFPVMEVETGAQAESTLEDVYGLRVKRGEILGKATHVFTHRIWEMTLVQFEAEAAVITELPETVWIELGALKHYALPTAFSKLLRAGMHHKAHGISQT